MKNSHVLRIIKMFCKNKRAVIYACIMCVLGLAVGIVTPICNGLMQDEILPNKNIYLFVVLTIVILVLNVVSVLSSYFVKKIMISEGVNITSNMRKRIVNFNIFNKKTPFNKGEVVIDSTKFLEETNNFLASYLYFIFDSILKFLFYLPFFLIYGRWLSLIMVAFAILGYIFMEIVAKKAKVAVAKSKIVDTERYSYMIDLLNIIQDKDFKEDEKYCCDTYMNLVYDCDKAWNHYVLWANAYTLIFSSLWAIGRAICFCLAFNMIGAGAITVSLFVAFNSYLEQIFSPLSNFVSYKQNSDQYNATLNRVFDLYDKSE